MSVYSGPNTNTSGLVLELDAANLKSYPGSGTTYFDMAESKNNLSYQINNGLITYTSAGPQSYFERTVLDVTADYYRTANTINLSSGFTFFVLMKTDGPLEVGTANGIFTNHSHVAFTGGGVCLAYINASDFRLTCNTGTGTSRTYTTYIGTTNIKGTWNLLAQRYNPSGTLNSLWVNGVKEYQNVYAMATQADYLDIFNWSTTYAASAAYRPPCKINFVSAYNRALTDYEMRQQFNALRGRFGI